MNVYEEVINGLDFLPDNLFYLAALNVLAFEDKVVLRTSEWTTWIKLERGVVEAGGDWWSKIKDPTVMSLADSIMNYFSSPETFSLAMDDIIKNAENLEPKKWIARAGF